MRHAWFAPRILIPLAAVIVAVQLPFIHWALRGAPPVKTCRSYEDNFDRASLGRSVVVERRALAHRRRPALLARRRQQPALALGAPAGGRPGRFDVRSEGPTAT